MTAKAKKKVEKATEDVARGMSVEAGRKIRDILADDLELPPDKIGRLEIRMCLNPKRRKKCLKK